jgi:ribose transport system permease protein
MPVQVVRLLGVSLMLGVLYAMLLVRIPFSRLLDVHQTIAQDIGLLVGDVFGVPNQLLWLLLVAVLLGLFLHGTKHGRYLFAIGANEEAARYAGIPTERYKVAAYLISSVLAGLSSLVFVTYNNTVSPTSGGSWLELYAITGAVLGGCSLRGGEGSAPGMFLGAAVLPVLRQLCYTYGIKSELEYAVIGAALLVGTVVDVLLKRRSVGRG